MNHPGASARLSCIVLTALDLGFTGIQIDRAPGLVDPMRSLVLSVPLALQTYLFRLGDNR